MNYNLESKKRRIVYFLFFIILAIFLAYFIFVLTKPKQDTFCCGDKSWRRIDVVYPPDIYVGQRGPFNIYTGFLNPWKNEARDQAFVDQRLNNPNRVVFLDT